MLYEHQFYFIAQGIRTRKESLYTFITDSVFQVFSIQFVEPFYARPTDTEVRIYSAVSHGNMNLELDGTL